MCTNISVDKNQIQQSFTQSKKCILPVWNSSKNWIRLWIMTSVNRTQPKPKDFSHIVKIYFQHQNNFTSGHLLILNKHALNFLKILIQVIPVPISMNISMLFIMINRVKFFHKSVTLLMPRYKNNLIKERNLKRWSRLKRKWIQHLAMIKLNKKSL